MFGIDGKEFLVIIAVAAFVLRPKDMPEMLRAFARGLAHIRAYAQEFRSRFDDILRDADMQETADSLRNIGNSVKNLDPRRKLQEFYASLERETAEEHAQRRAAEEADKVAAASAAAQSGATGKAEESAAILGEPRRAAAADARLHNAGFGGALGLDAAARAAIEGAGRLPSGAPAADERGQSGEAL